MSGTKKEMENDKKLSRGLLVGMIFNGYKILQKEHQKK